MQKRHFRIIKKTLLNSINNDKHTYDAVGDSSQILAMMLMLFYLQ